MDLAAGIAYNNFIDPVPYTLKFHFIGGIFDEYVVAYTCSECGDYGIQDIGSEKLCKLSADSYQFIKYFHFSVHVYVFTRVRNPNCTTIEKATKILTANNISLSDLGKVDQENCD